MDTQQEQELIAKAIHGDRDAFALLLQEHYMTIYKIVYKWCGNKDNAEDIAQEVCIKLGRAIKGFKMQSAFTSWVYSITLNTVRDFARKQKHHVDINMAEHVVDDTNIKPEDIDEINHLWQAVQQLPDNQRDAVMLVYSQELNHKQAADIMNCAEGTVSSYIHKAKKRLQKMVGEQGGYFAG